MTIQTYDVNSQVIDRIHGTAVDIRADGKFDLKDSDGSTVQKSSVLNVIVGGKVMLHVGSSLIAYGDGLENVFDQFSKTVDINNMDRSTPIINRLVFQFKNLTTGHHMLILVRSQTGTPLATFIGDSISYNSTQVDKSTFFWVDGKPLFIYRCDYTVYDLGLLQ